MARLALSISLAAGLITPLVALLDGIRGATALPSCVARGCIHDSRGAAGALAQKGVHSCAISPWQQQQRRCTLMIYGYENPYYRDCKRTPAEHAIA